MYYGVTKKGKHTKNDTAIALLEHTKMLASGSVNKGVITMRCCVPVATQIVQKHGTLWLSGHTLRPELSGHLPIPQVRLGLAPKEPRPYEPEVLWKFLVIPALGRTYVLRRDKKGKAHQK